MTGQDKDCGPTNTRTIREALEPSVPTWTLEHICSVLGLDIDMPLRELHRKNPCRCPIMTTAVYREVDLDWDDDE